MLLHGWGRTAPSAARLEAPADAGAAAVLVAGAGPRGVLARGLGRAYGDAAQNAGGQVLATRGLAGVRRFDAERGEVTVGAGSSLGELAAFLLPHGWFLPVVPGTRFVTVGGAIAADIHGKNHHRDGAFCAHVRAFSLLTPDGAVREVTPEGDPDAFAATAGGMGLTGVMLEATLRLLRVHGDRVLVDTERAADLDDLLARMAGGDHAYRYSVAWVDCLARGARLGRGVLMRANHAPGDGGVRRGPLAYAEKRPLPAPPAVRVVTPATVRAFNEAYYRRAPRESRGRPERLDVYFHPLDGMRGWNRLYGPRGLVQYQLAVPFGAEATLRRVFETFSGGRHPTFLAVLKRFGPGAGPLGFPMEGWTLAADLPAGDPDLGPVLDGLDELVAEAGGRVYLAKDARLRPELLGAMYPELERWKALRARLDPAGRMRSDLGRRLGLCGPGPSLRHDEPSRRDRRARPRAVPAASPGGALAEGVG